MKLPVEKVNKVTIEVFNKKPNSFELMPSPSFYDELIGIILRNIYAERININPSKFIYIDQAINMLSAHFLTNNCSVNNGKNNSIDELKKFKEYKKGLNRNILNQIDEYINAHLRTPYHFKA